MTNNYDHWNSACEETLCSCVVQEAIRFLFVSYVVALKRINVLFAVGHAGQVACGCMGLHRLHVAARRRVPRHLR